MNQDDILEHPLFSDHVPPDLNNAHSGFLALAHISSSSEELEVGPVRKRNKNKRPKKKSTPYDKEVKELTFVTSNWRPIAKSKSPSKD